MINKRNAVSIIGAVLVIAMVFSVFGTPTYRAMKLNNENFHEIKNKLKEAVNKNTEVDIKKLTNFKWDECYVFTPYYAPEDIYKKVGVEWTTTKTYMGFLLFHDGENQTTNDDQRVMVFKAGRKVVLSFTYNLNELPVVFKLDNYKFSRGNSKFKVEVAKGYAEGKIKELTLVK